MVIFNGKGLLLSLTFVILSFTVGFATIDTDLIKSNVNSELFHDGVRFISKGSKAPTIKDSTNAVGGFVDISGNGRTMLFETPTLTTLGQEVTITYYIENNSMYDVELSDVNCSIEDSPNSNVRMADYVTVIPSNNYSGKTLVSNSTTDDYDSIIIRLAKSYIGDEVSFKIVCSMDAPTK